MTDKLKKEFAEMIAERRAKRSGKSICKKIY